MPFDRRLLRLVPLIFSLAACGSESVPSEDRVCASDAECPMDERCLPSGQCRAGVGCLTSEECEDPRTECNSATFSCTFIEGFGDECGPGRACAFGQFCSNLLGLCLDSGSARDCTRRTQCPANQICDRAANKCIPNPGCFGDEFCEPGEVCDTVNRTCRSSAESCVSCLLGSCPSGALCLEERTECLAGNDQPTCRLGEFCDPLGRCVQCTSNDDCGPGTFCNSSIGRCESNIQCADDPSECPTASQVQCIVCTKPEVCERRTGQCSAPPEPCDSDLDCPNDQLCDRALMPPVCVPRLPDCLNDLFDAPRNDLQATARPLLEADGPSYDELRLCPGDIDWYRLEVSAGTFLTVDARFVHDEGDLELQLFLEDGTTLVDQSRSTTDNERVAIEVGTDLVLYLRVFLGTQTVRPLDYRLVVGRDSGQRCEDDAAEPNDSPAQAPQLLFDQPRSGRVCPADPDWYALRMVPAGARVILDLDFVDNLGNLDLEVYRAGSPNPLRAARGTADGERLEVDAPFGGDFLVRIVGAAADTNVYTVRASLLPGQGGTCRDDVLEPNDGPTSFSAGAPLLGTVRELSLCGGDEDWFEIELGAGSLLEAEMVFDAPNDLDLALFEPGTTDRNITPLRISNGIAPREYLAFQALQSGRYLLRVYGRRPTDRSNYQLRIQRSGSFTCTVDRNDQAMLGNARTSAIALGTPPNRQGESTICAGDSDWYQALIQGGFVNVIRLQYPSALARLDFELYDGMGAILFSSIPQGFQNLREVNVDVPGAGFGLVFVRVFSTDGRPAPYSLSTNLIPAFICNPDVEEPNDVPTAASTRTATTTGAPIRLEGLTLCPSTRRPGILPGEPTTGDEDWFVLSPPAVGARMSASIEFEQGDLLLELRSPGGVARACVNNDTDRCYSDGNSLMESVTFTATTTQPYLLRVSSIYSAPTASARPADADTPYRLDVRYSGP